MKDDDLVIYLEDNTVTFYKIYDHGEKSELAHFITEYHSNLSDGKFIETVKSIIIDNGLANCHVCVYLHESLFYSETKLIPKLPILLLYKLIKDELNCLFTIKRIKDYKLKIIESCTEENMIKVVFILTPEYMIKKLEKALKKLPVKSVEIIKKGHIAV